METDKYRKRRGRTKLDPLDKREHSVNARLNVEELALLDSKRGNLGRGEWMRCASLDKLPSVVPEPNKEKWQELGRCAANLNQVAKSLNQLKGISDDQFAEVRAVLNDFRRALLGAKNS